MHAWLITVGEPLPLPGRMPRLLRTGMLATELARRGQQVTWWTSIVDHFSKTRFAPDAAPFRAGAGFEVRFLEGRLYHRNVSLARLLNHREIARDFDQRAMEIPPPDVILCSLPTIELARSATRYGRSHGVRVLVDVRDLWPDVLLTAVARPLAPVARLALAPLYRQAAHALRDADGIVAISEGYLHWALHLARRSRRPGDRVIPLGYPRSTVTPVDAEAAWHLLSAAGVRRDGPTALFVGSLGRSYDLATVIDGAKSAPDVQFVIAGDGERAAEWRRQAAGLPNVVFTGWLEAPVVRALLGRASVGLAAYHDHALQGLPNKLFEYLSAGLPVVSSLSGETATLLEREQCGIHYRAGDTAGFIRALRQALDPGQHAVMRRHAIETFERGFASETVIRQLADALEAPGG